MTTVQSPRQPVENTVETVDAAACILESEAFQAMSILISGCGLALQERLQRQSTTYQFLAPSPRVKSLLLTFSSTYPRQTRRRAKLHNGDCSGKAAFSQPKKIRAHPTGFRQIYRLLRLQTLEDQSGARS